MTAYDRALELVDKLTAEGINATVDPRSATPPCVLIPPPRRTYDVACGYTAGWQVWALVPGTGTADAFKALDLLVDQVSAVFPVETAELASYSLTPDNPPFPAYRIEFSEGI